MNNQTDQSGRRLEDLYEAGLKLPPAQRSGFVNQNAGDDAELANRLRLMFQLENPVAANPLSTATYSPTGDSFDLKSNTEFGNCRIVTEKGAGGMGAVYLALDLQNHDRPVALKVMKPTLLGEADRQRFFNETSALSRLVHQNIARLYFWGIQHWQGADRPYLVMEYVEGKTLDQYLTEHHLTTKQTLELLRKIALAVHHGHLKGVYHRDLKPSNILVTPDGEPKIIDFGVSFMVSTDSNPGQETAVRENAGTLLYMAPEVAGGQAYNPDPRTDVYSLGIIAFEAFAKRRPGVELPTGDLQLLEYPLKSPEIRRKIADCERECLSGVDRTFRGDLDFAIAKALRLKMDQRYSDASELAEDFRRIISFEPIKGRPSSRIYTSRMFVRRNRFATMATVTIFLVVLAAAITEAVAVHVIRQKTAAAHFLAAGLAEQRGNWQVAAEQYRAAGEAHYPDRLALAIGELRALGRLDNRSADVNALIKRVHTTMPDIASSPQFQVVEGFIYWTSNPDESLHTIQQALVHADKLTPSDRAFAEALTTDDISKVAASLRETIITDPFNRDAWALMCLCDLALGDTQTCEQDASFLLRLYPDDPLGPVFASIGASFQGRRSAAVAYLDADTNLPVQLKETLTETIDLIIQNNSLDDVLSKNPIYILGSISKILVSGKMLSISHQFPIPLTFSRILADITSKLNPVAMILNHPDIYALTAKLPNGDGEFATGFSAIKRSDYTSAIKHLQSSLDMPSLIDCRRLAAITLVFAHSRDWISRKLPPNRERTAIIKADFDRIISLGGIHPEKPNLEPESNALTIAINYGLYPRVRTLSLLWLSHAPDDPKATYYLAVADANLGDRDTALALYKRAIANGLTGNEKSDAQNQIQKLTPSAATSPTTMPR